MRFSELTKRQARLRQNSNCGVCGDNLDWQEEFAHHIYPDALGGPDTVKNCVILCRTCHYVVHMDGRFRSGVVAPRSYYTHFNG